MKNGITTQQGFNSGGELVGRYLNPGCMKFQQVLNSEIYVDKTGMISYINSVVNTECCPGLHDGNIAD